MRIVVKEGESTVADLSFDRQAVYVGSRPGCGIHLPHAQVGEHHALFQPEKGDRWSIEPIQEGLETHINGTVLSSRRLIQHGDEIRIEAFELKVFLDGDAYISEMERATRHESVSVVRKHRLPAGAVVKKHNDSLTLSVTYLHRSARYAQTLLQCTTLRDLMELTLSTILGTFGGRCAWVGLRRRHLGDLEFVEGRWASGEPCERPALASYLAFRCLERAQHVCLPKTKEEEIGSALAVPVIGPDGHLGMIYVDRGKLAEAYEPIHLDLLSAIAAYTGMQMEAILHELVQRQEAMVVTEISVAHEVQSHLTPKSVPDWDTMQLAVYGRPGDTSCGDFYDLVKLPDGHGAVFLSSCNAPGGLSASVAGQLRAAFRLAALRGNPPHSLLRQMNWLLTIGANTKRVKCICLTFDPPTGGVTYAYAGDIGAVLIGAEGSSRSLIEEVIPQLGEEPDVLYAPKHLTLEPGETLALFTPGITQITNADGEPLGRERLIETFRDGFSQAAGQALALAQAEFDAFCRGGRRDYDISTILLHRSR